MPLLQARALDEGKPAKFRWIWAKYAGFQERDKRDSEDVEQYFIETLLWDAVCRLCENAFPRELLTIVRKRRGSRENFQVPILEIS